LKIEANQSVALVGESGSGKSTIVSLLLRFYDVDSGNITIDKCDIRLLPLGTLRRQLGLVLQDPILFNCSLYENILYGNLQAKNSDILKAARQAYVLDFIEQFWADSHFKDM